jgi:HrpA-like RNA helicase
MQPTSFENLDNLPIHQQHDTIIQAVNDNQVTIIVAETGAGKSTQVPQYLAEAGYTKVIVTQPRILAARNLSHRVREEYSWRSGHDARLAVGYRTAHERDDDPANTILYCTDGLQLVRELTGAGTNSRQILVLDELHEWNENMEVLVAWAKKRCLDDPTFKVVLMSATIEADTLARYFNTTALIQVEGRTFPVEKRRSKDLIETIITQARGKTSNMLVFLPGKAEIEAVAEAIGRELPKGVPVIPLHSQLEPEVQQLAFARYPNGKVILATNVAQTSITIDDIDTVVDSGLERRAEVRSGVEGLFIEQISQADCLQRAGRAGRTKPGLYVLASLERMPCAPFDERPAYGVPEIMRKHIDRLVLRLAAIGIDIESLEFYHAPSNKTIRQAKQTLVSLGALTREGTVTDMGRSMERFPVESSYARMLVEAEQYSPAIQAKLAAIMAIQEVNGIVKGGTRHTGWRVYTRQTRSDLLAQYDVYLAVTKIIDTTTVSSLSDEDLEEQGVIIKNVSKAQEVNERLNHDLGLGQPTLTPITDDEEEPLLRCIIAGQLHQIWLAEPGGQATHLTSRTVRELSSSSVVKHYRLVGGTPFDLEVATPKGLEVLHLVTDITGVDPRWLEALAPDTFKIHQTGTYFDAFYGMLATRAQLAHNGTVTEVPGVPILERTLETQQQFSIAYSKWAHDQLDKERRTLQLLTFKRIPAVPLNKVQDRVRHLTHGAISLHELSKQQRIILQKVSKLETYLGREFMDGLHIRSDRDNNHHHERHHRRPWSPQHKQKYNRRRGH